MEPHLHPPYVFRMCKLITFFVMILLLLLLLFVLPSRPSSVRFSLKCSVSVANSINFSCSANGMQCCGRFYYVVGQGYIVSNDRILDEWWIGKHLEWRGRGLGETLSGRSVGRSEKNHKNSSQTALCLVRDSTRPQPEYASMQSYH